MIYERFRRYSHLPHQVANNGINCYDTKISKYKKKLQHKYVRKNVTTQSRNNKEICSYLTIYWSSIHGFQKVINLKPLIKNVQYLKHLEFKTTFL